MRHFHQFILDKRMERDLTLREFCKLAELDPSNWSKIERGLARPPQSSEMINRISAVLELNEADHSTLLDLAIIDSIPSELLKSTNEKVLESLPILFKTVRGERPGIEELKALLLKIQESQSTQ